MNIPPVEVGRNAMLMRMVTFEEDVRRNRRIRRAIRLAIIFCILFTAYGLTSIMGDLWAAIK